LFCVIFLVYVFIFMFSFSASACLKAAAVDPEEHGQAAVGADGAGNVNIHVQAVLLAVHDQIVDVQLGADLSARETPVS
jgi:hypothetical protein